MKNYKSALLLSRKYHNQCDSFKLIIKNNWKHRNNNEITRELVRDAIKSLREARLTCAGIQELLLKLS